MKLSREDIVEAVNMKNLGYSTLEVAEHFKCNDRGLSKVFAELRKKGVAIIKNNKSKGIKKEVEFAAHILLENQQSQTSEQG